MRFIDMTLSSSVGRRPVCSLRTRKSGFVWGRLKGLAFNLGVDRLLGFTRRMLSYLQDGDYSGAAGGDALKQMGHAGWQQGG